MGPELWSGGKIKGPVVQSCPRIPKIAERGVKNSAGGSMGAWAGSTCFVPEPPLCILLLESSHKGKDLLPPKQILSFKIKAYFLGRIIPPDKQTYYRKSRKCLPLKMWWKKM